MGAASSKLAYTPYDLVLDIQSIDEGKAGWPIYVKDPVRVAEITALLERLSTVSYVPDRSSTPDRREVAKSETLTVTRSHKAPATPGNYDMALCEPEVQDKIKKILNLDNTRTIVSVIGAYNKGTPRSASGDSSRGCVRCGPGCLTRKNGSPPNPNRRQDVRVEPTG